MHVPRRNTIAGQAIDDSFHAGAVIWSSDRFICFSTKVWNADCVVAPCSARAPGSFQQDQFDKRLINTAKVDLEGETIVSGLGFFSKVRFEEGEAPGEQSSCVKTSVPRRGCHGWDNPLPVQDPRLIAGAD